ncbi:MAG: phytanoyl-CoA dioxygenase family protein [Armatimonadetes bacterium]|nr:phytanoyl-CoA dioxygenase family protein [Armatimonadota bacterium]MDE2206305.1 phytanoyl-CoA dioxygenase family protein [Armatimonadota bacterium]
MNLTIGQHQIEMGGPLLGELRPSNDLIGDWEGLRGRMEEDGYLFIRGLHRLDTVLAARRMILENLASNGQIDLNHELMEAVIAPGARGSFFGGSKALTRQKPFLDLVESPEIMGFFANLLQGDVITFDFKWLRLIGPGDTSGAHYDIVYMGRGTQQLYTTWTPIGDVPYALGPLVVLEGSHRNKAFDRVKATYGKMDVDRDHVTGAFSDDALEMVQQFGGRWLTTEFKAGDAILFGMFTMHGSVTHTGDRFRLSCDTRYQRADAPVDERWVGENPMAHYAWTVGETVPMAEARKQWRV